MEDNQDDRGDEQSDENLHHEGDEEPKGGESLLEEAEKVITDTDGRASRIAAGTFESGKPESVAVWTYRVTRLDPWPC